MEELKNSITKYIKVRNAMEEELAETFATDSIELLLGYCGIEEIPRQMYVVARSLALKMANRYQLEGFKNYSEGGISVGIDELLSNEEKTLVNRYKTVIRPVVE